MKLNRDNYEEYFILYMDNELNDEERRKVEIFAQDNADLKAELDMLLQSKLVPDADISFTNKEMLMTKGSSISVTNYEEWLLSYIDNELKAEERNDVERFVRDNPAIQKELNLLQQTKLQPEVIVFQNKESLYRREEKARIVSIRWWRIAVAAVLILGISTTAIILLNKKPYPNQDEVVKIQPEEKKPTNTPDPDIKKPNETPDNDQIISDNDQEKIKTPIKEDNDQFAVKQKNSVRKEKNKQPLQVKKDEPVITEINKDKKKTNDLPQPIDNPYVNKQIESNNPIVAIPSKESLTIPKDDIITTRVTPEIVEPSYAVEQSDGKKNKLRGFFRKVTRTFEKRTNIKATDDDDRLLIAGLAIKLN